MIDHLDLLNNHAEVFTKNRMQGFSVENKDETIKELFSVISLKKETLCYHFHPNFFIKSQKVTWRWISRQHWDNCMTKSSVVFSSKLEWIKYFL